MKHLICILSCAILFSCQNQINCIKKHKDTRFIKEMVVIKDTCRVIDNNYYESYYHNDTIVMAGYGDRTYRQGKWTFFNKGKKISEGEFKDSQPIGVWNYKDFGNIKWIVYLDEDKNYYLSLPKKWISMRMNKNSISIVNDTILDNFNIKIDITAGNLGYSLKEWNKSTLENLNKQVNVSDIKNKKIVGANTYDAYEFTFKEMFGDLDFFEINEFLVEHNDIIYLIDVAIRDGSDYTYRVIKEQILYSFKVNENNISF